MAKSDRRCAPFEIGCDNGNKVRVAFSLDCCDREAMSFLAITRGISGEDVLQQLRRMVTSLWRQQFGANEKFLRLSVDELALTFIRKI